MAWENDYNGGGQGLKGDLGQGGTPSGSYNDNGSGYNGGTGFDTNSGYSGGTEFDTNSGYSGEAGFDTNSGYGRDSGFVSNEPMMYCTNCGAQIRQGTQICPACGAKQRKKNPKKKLWIGIGVGAAGLIAAICIIMFIVSMVTAYKKPVKYLEKFLNTGKVSAMIKMSPEEMTLNLVKWLIIENDSDIEYEDLESYENGDFDELIDDFRYELEDVYEKALYTLEDTYGTDIRISIKVRNQKNFSNKELRDLKDQYETFYGFDKDDIKAAKHLNIKIQVKGDDSRRTSSMQLSVYKYKHKWYIDLINSTGIEDLLVW